MSIFKKRPKYRCFVVPCETYRRHYIGDAYRGLDVVEKLFDFSRGHGRYVLVVRKR